MRRTIGLFVSAAVLILTPAANVLADPAPVQKEWTLLVFLNGNNNLDYFGDMDINEMEQVGSTDSINVVVQWASISNGDTRRLLVQKDKSDIVTSPIVENMGKVDMGDWKSLVEFVRWGVEKYPAKKYFIDVWNHGGGWHRSRSFVTRDISWDDISGNFITTEQLADAMKESAAIIGHKVDLYGSDACLMAMAEVSSQMADSVQFYVGSEELEPGEGWPYFEVLTKWNAKKDASPADVAKILAEEYVKSYDNGTQGNSQVTFSGFDLSKSERLYAAVTEFARKVTALSSADLEKVRSAAAYAQSFTYADYVDLVDFLNRVEGADVSALGKEVVAELKSAVGEYVITNVTSSSYKDAHGLALWIPTTAYDLKEYADRYRALTFNVKTGWFDALEAMIGPSRQL